MIFPAEYRLSSDVAFTHAEAQCVALQNALAFYAERRDWQVRSAPTSCLEDSGEPARGVLLSTGGTAEVNARPTVRPPNSGATNLV